MNKTVYLSFLFIFLLFLQVFVLNNINLFNYINPYLYFSYIFDFHLQKKRITFLLSCFCLGLFIDFFSDSGGIHAFSILTVAYIRVFFIRLYFKKISTDYSFFNLKTESFGKKFNYIVTLTIIHHLILFSLINFSFNNFGNVLLNTLFSSIFTLLLFFLGTFIFTKKE